MWEVLSDVMRNSREQFNALNISLFIWYVILLFHDTDIGKILPFNPYSPYSPYTSAFDINAYALWQKI